MVYIWQIRIKYFFNGFSSIASEYLQIMLTLSHQQPYNQYVMKLKSLPYRAKGLSPLLAVGPKSKSEFE